MGELIFYTGGAKSGKSRLAQETVLKKEDKHVVYLATQANRFTDVEMNRSIALHRQSRPENWKTIEQTYDLDELVKDRSDQFNWVLVDCMTVWLTNLLFDYWQSLVKDSKVDVTHLVEELSSEEITSCEHYAMEELDLFLESIHQSPSNFVIISNEIGAGVVPEYKLSRLFRNIHGLMNQKIAQQAGQVYWVVSGIEVKIK